MCSRARRARKTRFSVLAEEKKKHLCTPGAVSSSQARIGLGMGQKVPDSKRGALQVDVGKDVGLTTWSTDLSNTTN
ncbi:hypothetical protein Y1Q_0014726 [Alligator mississippiensis]|uniref:Uncharacterized protein n=1 Tax=Alligator mississippiensis TaxID=8496 RepID=A0A151P883_ALLMI|nr:hypothetical protein Y1Q_0014726 [Alligator mississippiensis]